MKAVETINYILKNKKPNLFELTDFIIGNWKDITDLPFEYLFDMESVLNNENVKKLLEHFNYTTQEFKNEFNKQFNN